MHETDPEEARFDRPASGDEVGLRDGTVDDQTMDPEALDAPARTARPGQAGDQSAAPIPDVMGERGGATSDPMGAPIPETDETLGDRTEADRR